MTMVSLDVNGESVIYDVKDNLLLVDFIREKLKLTGTHIGCDTSQCGSCQVHFNDRAIKSCTMFALETNGGKLITIEGVAKEEKNLSALQQAFKKFHGLQCGFCTSGMIMTAIDLLKNNNNPSEAEIREYLSGNICRCTGYQNIVKAIKSVCLGKHSNEF